MENKIKIIITEDNSTIRDGLALLINATDGMECIAAFSSCEDMLEGINKFNPDIFLQDIELPGMSGIEGVKKVKDFWNTIFVRFHKEKEEEEKRRSRRKDD